VLVRAGKLPGGAPLEHVDVNALHSRGALRETDLAAST
jgi:hypothetical protein